MIITIATHSLEKNNKKSREILYLSNAWFSNYKHLNYGKTNLFLIALGILDNLLLK